MNQQKQKQKQKQIRERKEMQMQERKQKQKQMQILEQKRESFMEITDENSEYAKKSGKKGVQPGEMMVVAICFLAAAIILFIFDLVMYFVTKGRARKPIIFQSAVCVLFLAISLILGFAAFAQKNKLNRRHITEEACANTIDGEKEGTEQEENTDTNTDKCV